MIFCFSTGYMSISPPYVSKRIEEEVHCLMLQGGKEERLRVKFHITRASWRPWSIQTLYGHRLRTLRRYDRLRIFLYTWDFFAGAESMYLTCQIGVSNSLNISSASHLRRLLVAHGTRMSTWRGFRSWPLYISFAVRLVQSLMRMSAMSYTVGTIVSHVPKPWQGKRGRSRRLRETNTGDVCGFVCV